MCKHSYSTSNKTDNCSKCKGTTAIIKGDGYYKYVEKCQNKKCGHECMIAMALPLYYEPHYSSCPALEEKKYNKCTKLLMSLLSIKPKMVVKTPVGKCALCSL